MKLIDISAKVWLNFYTEITSNDLAEEYIKEAQNLVQEPDKLTLESINQVKGYFSIDGDHKLLVEYVFKSGYEEVVGQVLYHVETDKDYKITGYGTMGPLKIIFNQYTL